MGYTFRESGLMCFAPKHIGAQQYLHGLSMGRPVYSYKRRTCKGKLSAGGHVRVVENVTLFANLHNEYTAGSSRKKIRVFSRLPRAKSGISTRRPYRRGSKVLCLLPRAARQRGRRRGKAGVNAVPQGLKPRFFFAVNGMAKAMPFQNWPAAGDGGGTQRAGSDSRGRWWLQRRSDKARR